MKAIEKVIKIENAINLNLIDTKKEPEEKIKRIFEMICGEIKEKVNNYIQEKNVLPDSYHPFSFDRDRIFLSGGAISDTFIDNYKGVSKDYDFFILNSSLGFKVHDEKFLKDVLEKTYKGESELRFVDDKEQGSYGVYFKTKYIYKIRRMFEGEEINIDLIVSEDPTLEFDLSFREFYYGGKTILASAKALRDIKNKQISVNSLKTPRQTYYRMKEYEERFGMTASPVEKHILIRKIEEDMLISNKGMDFKDSFKTKYYTVERENSFYKEAKEMKLKYEVYTDLFKKTIRTETQQVVSVALEKARIMYELGIKEEELNESLKIKMPQWEPRKEAMEFYNKFKKDLVYKIKKYNKTKNLTYLYAEEDEKAEWLRGPFNSILREFIEQDDCEYSMNEEEIRFLLYMDDQLSLEQKSVVDEHDKNEYLGGAKQARKSIEEKEMEFKLKNDEIYLGNENISPDSKWSHLITLVGENGVEVLIRDIKEIYFYSQYGYLSEKRLNLLKQKLRPALAKMKRTEERKYRNGLYY